VTRRRAAHTAMAPKAQHAMSAASVDIDIRNVYAFNVESDSLLSVMTGRLEQRTIN